MTKSKKRYTNECEQSNTDKTVDNKSAAIQPSLHQSNDVFTLFSKKKHYVAWYVHRSKSIRDQLGKLWGKGPQDKKSLGSYNEEQMIVARTNALMRLLEKFGPNAGESPEFGIKLDKRHGATNNPKTECVSKGYYHAHVLDGNLTYVLAWECFEKHKVINILALSAHENLDYSFKGHKPGIGMKNAMAAAEKAKFNPGDFEHEQYNNRIYTLNY